MKNKYKLLVNAFDHKAGEVFEADFRDNVGLERKAYFTADQLTSHRCDIHAPSYPNMFKLVEAPKYTDGDLDGLLSELNYLVSSDGRFVIPFSDLTNAIRKLKESKSK